MKVLPTQTGDAAPARAVANAPAGGAGFEAALAKASSEAPAAITPRAGETFKAVEGRAYVDIVGGKRSGMYVNTSGNERHGQAFVLVHKQGREYHVYGSGKDRLVVSVKPPVERKPEAAGDDDLKLRTGEKIEPVDGRPYAEITSGARSGMFINTGGNDRHGEAFVLVNRGGVEYHIYGSGKDREVIRVGRRDDDDV